MDWDQEFRDANAALDDLCNCLRLDPEFLKDMLQAAMECKPRPKEATVYFNGDIFEHYIRAIFNSEDYECEQVETNEADSVTT